MEKVYCGLSQHDRLWEEVLASATVSSSFFSRALEDPPFRCPRCCGTLGRDEVESIGARRKLRASADEVTVEPCGRASVAGRTTAVVPCTSARN